jgi:hypothetical protein
MNVANLEPNVLLSKRARRVVDDIFEALKHSQQGLNSNRGFNMDPYIQTVAELLLLLVNYAQAEVNFVGLFKVRGHTHNLGESLLGMVERTIPIVEDTNSIPEFWLLQSTAAVSVTRLRHVTEQIPTLGSRR